MIRSPLRLLSSHARPNHSRFLQMAAAAAFFTKVGSIAFAYLQNIVLAHCMSSSGFGEYAMGMSLATALGVTVGAGQPTAIVRFWPQYVAQARPALARGSVLFGYTTTGLSCLVLAASSMMLFFADMGRFHFLSYAIPLTIAWTLSELFMAILRAKDKVLSALLPRDVLWRAVVTAIGLIAILRQVQISSQTILITSALILLGFVFWQACYDAVSDRNSDSYGIAPEFDVQFWIRTGARLWLGTTLAMVYTQVDTLMVGLFLTNSETGQFFVVQKTASLLMTALWGAVMVSIPLFSRLYHGQKEEELRRASALFALGVGGFAFAVYCSYLVFGKFILGFFGASYTDLLLPLVILSSGYLVDAFCGPAGIFLLIAGHERAQIGILLMALLAKLAMLPLIIPRFGLAGAVAIGCVSQALVPILFWIWIRRVIGIDLSIWGAVLYFWRAASERKGSAMSDAPRQELEHIRSGNGVKGLRWLATLKRDGIALLGPGTYD